MVQLGAKYGLQKKPGNAPKGRPWGSCWRRFWKWCISAPTCSGEENETQKSSWFFLGWVGIRPTCSELLLASRSMVPRLELVLLLPFPPLHSFSLDEWLWTRRRGAVSKCFALSNNALCFCQLGCHWCFGIYSRDWIMLGGKWWEVRCNLLMLQSNTNSFQIQESSRVI